MASLLLNRLPNELILCICDKLHPSDVCRLKRVNSRMNELLNQYPSIWKQRILYITPQELRWNTAYMDELQSTPLNRIHITEPDFMKIVEEEKIQTLVFSMFFSINFCSVLRFLKKNKILSKNRCSIREIFVDPWDYINGLEVPTIIEYKNRPIAFAGLHKGKVATRKNIDKCWGGKIWGGKRMGRVRRMFLNPIKNYRVDNNISNIKGYCYDKIRRDSIFNNRLDVTKGVHWSNLIPGVCMRNE